MGALKAYEQLLLEVYMRYATIVFVATVLYTNGGHRPPYKTKYPFKCNKLTR